LVQRMRRKDLALETNKNPFQMESIQKIAEIFNERGSFSINKVQVYKNGKKIENRFKFNEVVSINHYSKEFLEVIAATFPQKILKTQDGFKLSYVGRKAAKLLDSILMFLIPEKREQALIILELSKNKEAGKSHSPAIRLLERERLKSKLESLRR
jgi:hypothetical protein